MSPRTVLRRPGMGALALVLLLFALALPATALAQEQPKRGGTLVVGINGDPPTLNGLITTQQTTLTVNTQIFSSLVTIDRDMKVHPELVESWDISPDGMSYTFHVRKNVKFHDGVPMTAEDIKYSLMEVSAKYKGTVTVALENIASIDVTDPYTLVIKMKNPMPGFFPWTVGVPCDVWVLPKHLYQGTDPMKNEYNLKPIGTGPFVFKEWVRGDHITLERNPNYYIPDRPYLDRVVFKILPDAGARVIALEKGEVDYLNYLFLPRTSVKTLENNPNIEVVMDKSRLGYGVITLIFNVRQPPLQNKTVRQAIAYAVDKKMLVDKAVDGLGDPGTGPISSYQKTYYNPNLKKYDFDTAKANQLLDQAGFPKKADGSRFGLRLSFTRGDQGGAIDSAADMLREQLRAVGIDVQLQPMDAAAWSESAWVKWDFDMTVLSTSTGPDPYAQLARFYTTDNIQRAVGKNASGYSNPEVDALFAAASKEVDEKKLVQAFYNIQAALVEDLPRVWLWDNPSPEAFRKVVKGGLPVGASHWEHFDDIWLTTAGGDQGISSTPAIVAGVVVVLLVAGGVFVIRRRRAA